MRTFDAVAFKQAALMMDQMEATRLAALSPHDRALKLSARAKDYFNRGLLLGSRSVCISRPRRMTVRWRMRMPGLAAVRERTGDIVDGPQRGQCGSEAFAFPGCIPGFGSARYGSQSHGRRQQGYCRGVEDRPRQCDRKRTESGNRGEVREETRSDWSEPCLSKCVDSSSAMHSA